AFLSFFPATPGITLLAVFIPGARTGLWLLFLLTNAFLALLIGWRRVRLRKIHIPRHRSTSNIVRCSLYVARTITVPPIFFGKDGRRTTSAGSEFSYRGRAWTSLVLGPN